MPPAILLPSSGTMVVDALLGEHRLYPWTSVSDCWKNIICRYFLIQGPLCLIVGRSSSVGISHSETIVSDAG